MVLVGMLFSCKECYCGNSGLIKKKLQSTGILVCEMLSQNYWLIELASFLLELFYILNHCFLMNFQTFWLTWWSIHASSNMRFYQQLWRVIETHSLLRSSSTPKYRASTTETYSSWWALKLVTTVENIKISLTALKPKFVCVDNTRWVKRFFGDWFWIENWHLQSKSDITFYYFLQQIIEIVKVF